MVLNDDPFNEGDCGVVVCHQAQHPQAKQLHFCVDPRNSFRKARVRNRLAVTMKGEEIIKGWGSIGVH